MRPTATNSPRRAKEKPRRTGASRSLACRPGAEFGPIAALVSVPGIRPAGSRLARPGTTSSVIVGALSMVGEVEALALLVRADAQADHQVDDLVEDRRPDARPAQRQQHRLGLREERRAELVHRGGQLAGLR